MINQNPQLENIQFVRFASKASASEWMSRAAAIDFINTDSNWTLNTPALGLYTDYDDALTASMAGFGTPPAAIDLTVRQLSVAVGWGIAASSRIPLA